MTVRLVGHGMRSPEATMVICGQCGDILIPHAHLIAGWVVSDGEVRLNGPRLVHRCAEPLPITSVHNWLVMMRPHEVSKMASEVHTLLRRGVGAA